MFIDTHAHIDAPAFDDDRDAVMERAQRAGVDAVIIAGAARTEADMRRTVAVAAEADNRFASCGVHPNDAQFLDEALLRHLTNIVETEAIVAVGESGLDFHYDRSPIAAQRDAFDKHIQLACTHSLPLICHVRDAHAEALEMLTKALP